MVLWQKSHTKSVHPSTTTVCRQIVRSATVLAPVQSCSVQLIGLTVTWICLGNFCSDCTILGGRNYGNSKNLDLYNAIYVDLFFGFFWVICFCGSDRMVFLITILHHHLEEYLETRIFPFASFSGRRKSSRWWWCDDRLWNAMWRGGKGFQDFDGKAVLKDGRSQWYDKWLVMIGILGILWANYSDLSRGHPKLSFKEGIPPQIPFFQA